VIIWKEMSDEDEWMKELDKKEITLAQT